MAVTGTFPPYIQTTKDTVPASIAGTGTISSAGTSVVGTASVAQVDTTTLTGTSGEATITIQGKAAPFPFVESLEQTAKTFAKNYDSFCLALGVKVGYSGVTITFTSLTPGVAITVSNAVNTSGDLAGTTATTTANANGVDFLSLPSDVWIYDPAQNEVRHVEKIADNNTLIIDYPFTADLSGIAFRYVGGVPMNATGLPTDTNGSPVSAEGAFPREISLTNTGGADADLNGNANSLQQGVTITNAETMISRGTQKDRTSPIVLDATGTTVLVSPIY